MIAIEALSHRYGSLLALDRIDLALGQGEFLGLLGPNGAGKSTLMSILSGFRRPESGRILLDGVDTIGGEALRGVIGLAPQSIALYTDLSAAGNLEAFGRLAGMRGSSLRDRVAEVLGQVGLADRAKDPVRTFSGGMQRRVNLAVALLHRPRVLLCDEPTVGVDPQSRNAIFDLLESLHREGTTIVYSTHYMEEAERLCTRIGIIDHGRMLALGTLDELLAKLPFEAELSIRADRVDEPMRQLLSRFGDLRPAADRFHLSPREGFRLSALFVSLEQAGVPPSLVTVRRPSLETLFLQLTGHQLRD